MSEINTTPALIRGVAARFAQMGCKVEGFDAYCESTVLPGSGLSSSAAYEVLIGTIINHLYFDGKVSQPEIAMIGQYAENVFFGKPCGLMDQTASAVGNLVTIDFFETAAELNHERTPFGLYLFTPPCQSQQTQNFQVYSPDLLSGCTLLTVIHGRVR